MADEIKRDKAAREMFLSVCLMRAEAAMDFSVPESPRSLKKSVRRLVETELKPHDAAIEESGRIKPRALDATRAFGFYGSNTPKRYDGLGLDMLGNCFVIEEMARAHIAYFYTYSMYVHIASKAIELHGSDAQRQRWLPGLASGRVLGCYALTEEGAGSDAPALQTTAIRRNDSYVLNGAKRYITNAPVADLFTIFAAQPEEGARARNSAFIVEKGAPGLRIGRFSARTYVCL